MIEFSVVHRQISIPQRFNVYHRVPSDDTTGFVSTGNRLEYLSFAHAIVLSDQNLYLDIVA